MKKLLVTMLAVMATGASYALPVGNPSEASLLCDGLFWEGNCMADPCNPGINFADAFSLRIGFYGDYVFNRHLRQTETVDDEVDDINCIEHTRINTNAGYIALNFWDRIDVFTTLGATNLSLDTNAFYLLSNPELVNDGQRIEIETDTRFSWSIGGRATLWEMGCTSLGLEGQYFRTNTHVKRVTVADAASVYTNGNLENDFAPYSEWQLGLGLSHRINMIVPYIAVKYSRAFWDFEDDTFAVPGIPGADVGLVHPGDLRNSNHWGYAVGVSIIDCEKAALNVEGRFGDEKAVSVLGQIRF